MPSHPIQPGTGKGTGDRSGPYSHATQQHALSGVGWLGWAASHPQVPDRLFHVGTGLWYRASTTERSVRKRVTLRSHFAILIHRSNSRLVPPMRLNPALSLSAHSRHRRPQLHIPPLSLKRTPSSLGLLVIPGFPCPGVKERRMTFFLLCCTVL